jgi:large subunit ribosomal protein L30
VAVAKKDAPKKRSPKAYSKQLKLTLLRSRFGRTPGHAECLQGLGLRNRHQSVVVAGTPENLGMIEKVKYMLQIEEA